jgi:hypothetical protein
MSFIDNVIGAVQNRKSDQKSGKGGWIAALITGVLALLGIALLAWQSWKSGKELAKLQHEKAVREEQAHQAQVDAKLAVSEEAKKKALELKDRLVAEIEEIKKDAAEVKTERKQQDKLFEKIKSWDDVDTIVKHKKK